MSDTVIIYASFAGTARRVANYLAEKLGADTFDLKLQTNIDLSSYRKVILGCGIHAGKPYGKLTRYLEENCSVLNDKDVYLYLTCIYRGERAEAQCSEIAQDLKIANAVFFSTKTEKNEAGLAKDVDAFAERMSS